MLMEGVADNATAVSYATARAQNFLEDQEACLAGPVELGYEGGTNATGGAGGKGRLQGQERACRAFLTLVLSSTLTPRRV